MKTRAAVLHRTGSPFEIETLELEPPRTGEVLVRMEAAGVCHSDYHLVSGATPHPLPVVAGHEGAGVVESTGPGVTRLAPGQRVCLNWAPGCGGCFYCLKDRPNLCSTYLKQIWEGKLLDGTTRFSREGLPVHHFSALSCFAERTVVPEAACVPLSGEVPAAVAALIGCAVTTGVGAVINTARLEPGTSAAVFGAGGVGLSIVLGARLAGAAVIIALDRVREKLEAARALGADQVLENGPEALERLRGLTGGRGADYVFDATGIPAVQERCLEAARPGGKVVLVGIAPRASGTNLPGALIVREEKTVIGSYYGSSNPARDFPLYGSLYLGGRLDLDRLISKRYPLSEINAAYRDLLAGRLARGVIVF